MISGDSNETEETSCQKALFCRQTKEDELFRTHEVSHLQARLQNNTFSRSEKKLLESLLDEYQMPVTT
jgi:hypothetical protein